MSDATFNDSQDSFCESCRYSLRGLTTNRCPECGTEFDPDAPPVARIPWLQRSQIGTWKAYWRTVFAVTFHPKAFANETARPVALRAADANHFRRLINRQATATITFLAILIIPGLLPAYVNRVGYTVAYVLPMTVGVWSIFALAAATLPMLTFHQSDETRLRVLHSYASAPWAFMPLIIVIAVTALLAIDVSVAPLSLWPLLFFDVVVLFIVVWIYTVVLLSKVLRFQHGAIFEVLVALPFTWLNALVVGSLAGLCVWGLMLVVASLQ